MEIKQKEVIYEITHEDFSITVIANADNTLTIKTYRDHGSFQFMNSTPETIRKMGELFIKASTLGIEKKTPETRGRKKLKVDEDSIDKTERLDIIAKEIGIGQRSLRVYAKNETVEAWREGKTWYSTRRKVWTGLASSKTSVAFNKWAKKRKLQDFANFEFINKKKQEKILAQLQTPELPSHIMKTEGGLEDIKRNQNQFVDANKQEAGNSAYFKL